MPESFQQQVNKILSKRLKDKSDVKNIKDRDLKKAGKELVESIKDAASKGISPVAGKPPRFPAYKNPKTGYPSTVRNKFPGKKTRPVNLFLAGDFLKKLKIKVKSGKKASFNIGFFDTYGKDLERGHREGANTQPKRPLIPQKNEGFKPNVLKDFKKILIDALKKAIAK